MTKPSTKNNIIIERDTVQTLTDVTRFEVIGDTGRLIVRDRDGVKVSVSLQDDGRTLKIFLDNDS